MANSILVTGGSGFIGSNLALELQNRHPKASLIVLDDFRGSSFKNLLGFCGEVMAYDAADPSWMERLSDRPVEAIFHLASITDTTVLDEKKMMFDNVEGFRNVLEFALKKKADVVYASSAAVYGGGAVPAGGSQDTPMKESDAGHPNNIYGFSKWTMEGLAKSYEGRLKVVGLRYFNVFGPRETFKGPAASMIYQLARQMMESARPRIFKFGEQKRDFIYVKDVVEATIRARAAKQNTSVNVGTGQATSFNEVIAALNEALGTHLQPDYFDNPYDFYQNFTQADMAYTKKTIGFQRRYSTREGILDYVRNYLLPQAKNAKPVGISSQS